MTIHTKPHFKCIGWFLCVQHYFINIGVRIELTFLENSKSQLLKLNEKLVGYKFENYFYSFKRTKVLENGIMFLQFRTMKSVTNQMVKDYITDYINFLAPK